MSLRIMNRQYRLNTNIYHTLTVLFYLMKSRQFTSCDCVCQVLYTGFPTSLPSSQTHAQLPVVSHNKPSCVQY